MIDVTTPLIVAVGVVVGPLSLAYLTGRQRRTEKLEDYARQDAVAAQAAVAAELLEARQNATASKAAEATRLLLASDERGIQQAAEATAVTNGKLSQIHELVNSNLTAQMEDAYAAQVQQLVLMREVVSLNEAAGRPVSAPALEAIAVLQAKIAERHLVLIDRAKATEVADSKVP